jgi:hypothetical protein
MIGYARAWWGYDILESNSKKHRPVRRPPAHGPIHVPTAYGVPGYSGDRWTAGGSWALQPIR